MRPHRAEYMRIVMKPILKRNSSSTFMDSVLYRTHLIYNTKPYDSFGKCFSTFARFWPHSLS